MYAHECQTNKKQKLTEKKKMLNKEEEGKKKINGFDRSVR